MNPPYAVAGADIEVGMWVQLSPTEDAFRVSKVEPYDAAPTWVRVYDEQFRPKLAQKTAWYAEVGS